jgi:hypothetical protein
MNLNNIPIMFNFVNSASVLTQRLSAVLRQRIRKANRNEYI